MCNRFSAYSSCDCGACSRSSCSSDGCDDGGGDDGGDDGCSGDGCDDGGGCNSGGKSEQTHYSQQVDLLQKSIATATITKLLKIAVFLSNTSDFFPNKIGYKPWYIFIYKKI